MRPYLSVASNVHNTSSLRHYREAGADEIFVGAGTVFGSGRPAPGTVLAGSAEKIGEHLTEARRLGLKTALLLNPACTGNREFSPEGTEWILQLCEWINAFQVDWVTIGNPWFVKVFREYCPNVKIKISSHYNCDDMNKFTFFLETLEVDMVIVSQFANKNFRLLREVVKKFGGERLEVMCTVPCIGGCPYRTWHSLASSHGEHAAPEDCDFPCLYDMSKPNIAVSSFFIRREDLRYYQQLGINTFKIGERFAAPEKNANCISYYRGGSEEGLNELIFPKGTLARVDLKALDGFYDIFFNEICDGTTFDCMDCNHCMKYAKKALHFAPERTQLIGEERLRSRKDMFSGYARLLKRSVGEE